MTAGIKSLKPREDIVIEHPQGAKKQAGPKCSLCRCKETDVTPRIMKLITRRSRLTNVLFLGIPLAFLCLFLFTILTKNTPSAEKIHLAEKSYTRENTQLQQVKVCDKQEPFKNIYSRNPKTGWTLNDDVCRVCPNFRKSKLQTPYGETPIYIYKAAEDIYISKDIQTAGIFDKQKVLVVLKILQTDKSLDLIDIGANIGVFTLSAAKLGRRVIAIDALNTNIQHLCFSVREGGFEKNVTIIHNAVADRSGMIVNLGVQKNNVGGTFIDFKSENIRKVKKELKATLGGSYGNISTIILDEILELDALKSFKNVVVKMDIEGFEDRVLLGATAFFKTLNIRAVFMEWVYHRNVPSGVIVIDLMTKAGFIPFTESGGKLSVASRTSWPEDVLWLPNSSSR
ncbi:hypothetical protein KUTeg_019615 [Tegillarca granosa]|uniref:Methyltransferase FkbM domain-containing protein n=1 Tax=Tegillarca granosa TaxID=220873 RepID=A0ABQ9ED37_TEGGR|nr:hypothetical protein KUTeg_019615 [Tegillarca granosa]